MPARHSYEIRSALLSVGPRPWWMRPLLSPEALVEAATIAVEERAAYARLGL